MRHSGSVSGRVLNDIGDEHFHLAVVQIVVWVVGAGMETCEFRNRFSDQQCTVVAPSFGVGDRMTRKPHNNMYCCVKAMGTTGLATTSSAGEAPSSRFR